MDNINVNVIYNDDIDNILICVHIKDIKWHNIKYISGTTINLKNLLWLQTSSSLQELHVDSNDIVSLDSLQEFTALHTLSCNNNKLTSLNGLQSCVNLLSLYVSYNNITSIDYLDGLQNCTSLQKICCDYNNISSLNGLQNCTALQKLYCRGNNLSSLNGIQNCTALQKLDVVENKLNSLNGIQNCICLQELNMSANKLTSLGGIQNCTALQTISCNYNNISSLNGLQNCTYFQQLFISNNTAITTLPNFLIELRYLHTFHYAGLELELDARQRRWLNRLQNRQHNTNNIQVYGNSQNVHDSSIQESVRASMSRLLNQPLLPTYNVDTLTNNIVLDTVLTPKSKDQLLSYISTSTSTSTQEELVELSLTYGELLWTVWQTIHNLGEFDESTQQQIKQILNQELEDSDCKCFTGRMTRLVNVLNGFSPLVEVKILDSVQIGNIVAIIKQRLEESEDGYGYTVAKHREEFRKEMLDRGESMDLINEWLEYIE